MNKMETKELLDKIARIDNRKLTPELVEAWHEIVAHIPFDIAQEALKLAQQDSSIKYLEPRHIVGWAKEAAFRLDRNKPKDEPIINGDPMPVCREHNTPILACDPCCHRLWKYKEQHGLKDIDNFARKEIYV
jgi:hypothetical protein